MPGAKQEMKYDEVENTGYGSRTIVPLCIFRKPPRISCVGGGGESRER